MSTNRLSPQAMQIIDSYLHLPIAHTGVRCPYFNNRHSNVHGGLRALVGKGSVEDITEEVTILSLKERIKLSELSAEGLTRFLVDHHIGIDCSGLVYYILDAEIAARGHGSIQKHLVLPRTKNPLRILIRKCRFVTSVNTRTFARDDNSHTVSLKDIAPGDLIILLDTGKEHDRDHLLIVHDVEKEQDAPRVIHYTHAFQWRTDGKYGHGVRQGAIHITDITQPLLSQQWIEENKEGKNNETLEHAMLAKILEIRRLNILI